MVKYNERTRKATFEMDVKGATHVAVLGEFNNWTADTHALKKTKAGKWKGEVKLEPGRYEFIYRVDRSNWILDDKCERVPNTFGSENSVFTAPAVKPPKTIKPKKKKKD